MIYIKYGLFISLLLLTSIRDIKTRIIPDYYHLAIALVALIGFKPIFSLIGILSALPFLMVAVIKNNDGIGGADIKFMAACGFSLGLPKGLLAGIIGLVLFIIFSIIKDFRKEKKCYPMIPFLTVGMIIGLLVI